MCSKKMPCNELKHETKKQGVGHSGTGVPGQRPFRKRVVPAAGDHNNDLLPLGVRAVDRRSERWTGIVNGCDLLRLTFNELEAYAYGTKSITPEQIAEKAHARKRQSGSFASAEAVAHSMTRKFVIYSPLYRLEQEINREG